MMCASIPPSDYCSLGTAFGLLLSGFPERIINLLIIFHICQYISIGLSCMGASEELRRMEIRLAAKSNNKQIINMNRQ